MEELRRRIILSGILIFLIVSSGTIGYMVIEKWNLLDSIYMTITTLIALGEISKLKILEEMATSK